MALTPSNMLALHTKAAEFSLPDTDGNLRTLADVRGDKGTLVMFICNHCPFVVHLKTQLGPFAKECMERGVGVVAISANDIESYPDDSPEKMAADKKEFGYPFPYLYDETQNVAKAYDAACTPDFYLFDANLKLAYRGQFDASRPGNDKPVTGEDLRLAVDLVVAGDAVPEPHAPSIGCNIKWKA